MLSAATLKTKASARRRSPYSDKQYYQEYILQRIEGYKNSIGRDELLRLGDEAAAELQAAAEGQFVLTEVLMLESVDRIIMKRLSLRPYRKWRQQFLKLREAQRTPTHWGLEPDSILTTLLPRMEPEDQVLIVGSGGEPATFLFAAHDAAVTFVAADLGSIERVETRIAAEALAGMFEGYVVYLGPTLPGFLDAITGVDLVVLDPGALLELDAADRCELVRDLQARTRPGGVHAVLPSCPNLAPEALLSLYDTWHVEESRKPRRRGAAATRRTGLVLVKPCLADTT